MSGALDRIKANQTAYPAIEGTFLHDAFAPVAGELDMMTDEYMPAALAAVMPDTAILDDLDRVGSAYGIDRKPSAKARGEVRFTGDANTVISAGIPVSTATGRVFLTDSEVTIPAGGSVLCPVTAFAPGVAYNVPAGVVVNVPLTLVGVQSATNPAPMTGGADVESDTSYRERLLMRIRLPSASGCEADYIRWAREVPGIAGAACVPIWNGPGTVKVIVAGEGMSTAGPELLASVVAYIERVRPIGAQVTVVSVQSLPITISVQLVLRGGFSLDAVRPAAQAALMSVISKHEFGAPYLPYAHVGAALLAVQGVADYSSLLLNGVASNVALTSEQVPALGTVTIT